MTDYDSYEEVIYLYNNGTIPFIGENENGYFKLNGDKVAINKKYMFLDVNDNINVIAKETVDNPYLVANVPEAIFIVNDKLQVISDTYTQASITHNFITLSKEDDDGDLTSTVWNKEGEKILENQMINKTLNDTIIVTREKYKSVKDDSKTNYIYKLYNKDGKINDKIYSQIATVLNMQWKGLLTDVYDVWTSQDE